MASTYTQSREAVFGAGLAEGKTTHEMTASSTSAIEGISNLVVAAEYAREYDIFAPVFSAIYSIVHAGRSPVRALRELMSTHYSPDVDFG